MCPLPVPYRFHAVCKLLCKLSENHEFCIEQNRMLNINGVQHVSPAQTHNHSKWILSGTVARERKTIEARIRYQGSDGSPPKNSVKTALPHYQDRSEIAIAKRLSRLNRKGIEVLSKISSELNYFFFLNR